MGACQFAFLSNSSFFKCSWSTNYSNSKLFGCGRQQWSLEMCIWVLRNSNASMEMWVAHHSRGERGSTEHAYENIKKVLEQWWFTFIGKWNEIIEWFSYLMATQSVTIVSLAQREYDSAIIVSLAPNVFKKATMLLTWNYHHVFIHFIAWNYIHKKLQRVFSPQWREISKVHNFDWTNFSLWKNLMTFLFKWDYLTRRGPQKWRIKVGRNWIY